MIHICQICGEECFDLTEVDIRTPNHGDMQWECLEHLGGGIRCYRCDDELRRAAGYYLGSGRNRSYTFDQAIDCLLLRTMTRIAKKAGRELKTAYRLHDGPREIFPQIDAEDQVIVENLKRIHAAGNSRMFTQEGIYA